MSEKKLELKVLLALADKVTRPLKAITEGSSATAKALKATKDQLKELNQANERIDAFRKASKDAAITANQVKAAQQRVRQLKEAMSGTLTPSREMTRALEKARQEVSHYGMRLSTLIEKKTRLRAELVAANVPLDNLKRHQAALRGEIDQASDALARQMRVVEAHNQKLRRLHVARAQYDKAIATRNKVAGAGVALGAAGVAIGAPVINAVREYSSFEDAMLGIQRQVQGIGDVGSASYKAIATEIKQLGRELPIATNQIADMYTAAARMEVPREGLRDFTRTVAMMSTAFDAVPDEIAEAMGKVAKNFRIPVTAIRDLADTINYLDDNAISKASDIIDVLNRTSGVAATVALSDKATAALASTLLTLGERTEAAGTAVNAILQRFAAAEKGTKKFHGALQEIGLSASAVQAGMQTDAQGTLFKVIEAIQRLPAKNRTGVMVELVGMEHSDTLAKLAANTAEWRRQIELANGAAAKGSMEREFLKRTTAMSAGWERLKNSFFDVNTESGAALRGSLMGVMEGLAGVLNRIADFMRENPRLTTTLVTTVAVVAALAAGLGALALAGAAVIGPFAVMRYGMALFGINGLGLTTVLGRLGGALSWVGRGIAIIGRALLLNPIGLAVTAIAVAAFLIYKYWDPIKAFFLGLWDQIKAAFNGGLLGITQLIINWSPVGLFYQAFAAVLNWFGIELPGKFTDFGAMMLQGMAKGILGAMGWVKDAIMTAADSTVGWFKEKLGIRSPSRVFAALGGHTMAGLERGISANQDGPVSAMINAGKRLTAAGTAIALSSAAMAGTIQLDQRAPIAAASSQPAIVQTVAPVIQIYAAPGMSPEDIARVVEQKMAQIQRDAAARARSRLTDRE